MIFEHHRSSQKDTSSLLPILNDILGQKMGLDVFIPLQKVETPGLFRGLDLHDPLRRPYLHINKDYKGSFGRITICRWYLPISARLKVWSLRKPTHPHFWPCTL